MGRMCKYAALWRGRRPNDNSANSVAGVQTLRKGGRGCLGPDGCAEEGALGSLEVEVVSISSRGRAAYWTFLRKNKRLMYRLRERPTVMPRSIEFSRVSRVSRRPSIAMSKLMPRAVVLNSAGRA